MKTINFELSERLVKLGALDEIETEYFYINQYKRLKSWKTSEFLNKHKVSLTKTLTLEEVVEFLPNKVWFWSLTISKNTQWEYDIYYRDFATNKDTTPFFIWKTQLEVIEKMLTYLLDSNLI